MPTNRKRITRKARGNYSAFERAVLGGLPFPKARTAQAGMFAADYRIENPTSRGLLVGQRPLSEIWREFYGQSPTKTDLARIRGRADEARDAISRARAAKPPRVKNQEPS